MDDDDSLSGISLKWMLDNLSKKYSFKKELPDIEGNFKGVAHWSIGDFPGNFGSKCEDRTLLPNAKIHSSYKDRKAPDTDLPTIRIAGEADGKPHGRKYPIFCCDVYPDTPNCQIPND